jgi:hypothetical protein
MPVAPLQPQPRRRGALSFIEAAPTTPSRDTFSLRAEYRGFVYKSPSFNLASLKTDAWTHMAQPSAGIVYRF